MNEINEMNEISKKIQNLENLIDQSQKELYNLKFSRFLATWKEEIDCNPKKIIFFSDNKDYTSKFYRSLKGFRKEQRTIYFIRLRIGYYKISLKDYYIYQGILAYLQHLKLNIEVNYNQGKFDLVTKLSFPILNPVINSINKFLENQISENATSILQFYYRWNDQMVYGDLYKVNLDIWTNDSLSDDLDKLDLDDCCDDLLDLISLQEKIIKGEIIHIVSYFDKKG